MDIDFKVLSRELILVLLLCKDLKIENEFKEIKKLYLGNDKVFWKYIYHFFNALKITEERFTRLSKVASNIHNKLINENASLSPKDVASFDYVKRRIRDRYENSGELYELKDFIDYIDLNSSGFIKNKVYISILLDNGYLLANITKNDFYLNKNNIIKIIVGKEEKLIFTKTSEYSFITKDKDDSLNIKIKSILNPTDKIIINKKEDLIGLVREDQVKINKDLVINCDIDLDINIKCKNLYSSCNLKVGNIEANIVSCGNIKANCIKVVNIECNNLCCRSIEALNGIKANNIKYYSICFAYNNISCMSIEGSRKNSKHFVLDGEILVNGCK